MSFEWNRIHKWEEEHQRRIAEDVQEYVLEFYGVEDIIDLTDTQLQAMMKFVEEELPENHIMIGGFYDLVNRWESEQ